LLSTIGFASDFDVVFNGKPKKETAAAFEVQDFSSLASRSSSS